MPKRIQSPVSHAVIELIDHDLRPLILLRRICSSDEYMAITLRAILLGIGQSQVRLTGRNLVTLLGCPMRGTIPELIDSYDSLPPSDQKLIARRFRITFERKFPVIEAFAIGETESYFYGPLRSFVDAYFSREQPIRKRTPDQHRKQMERQRARRSVEAPPPKYKISPHTGRPLEKPPENLPRLPPTPQTLAMLKHLESGALLPGTRKRGKGKS